jgi:hypothetical protein
MFITKNLQHYVVALKSGAMCVISSTQEPTKKDGYTFATGPFSTIEEAKAYRNSFFPG